MWNRNRGKSGVVGPLERLDERITPVSFGNFSTFSSPFVSFVLTGGNAATSSTVLTGTTTPSGGVFGGTAFNGGAAAFGGNTFGTQATLGGLNGTSAPTFTNANAGGTVYPFATSASTATFRNGLTNVLGSIGGTLATPGNSGTTAGRVSSFTPGVGATTLNSGSTAGQSFVITGGGALVNGLKAIASPTASFLNFNSPFTSATRFGFVNNATGATAATNSLSVSPTTPGVSGSQPLSLNLGSTSRFGFTSTINSPNQFGFGDGLGQFTGLSLSNSGVGAGGGVI